jgi:hypothetical protein
MGLRYGIELAAPTVDEQALVTAGQDGEVDEGRRLLHKGVCANCTNSLGLTPAMVAAANGHEKFLQMLLAHPGVQPDKQNPDYGWTPLHYAVNGSHQGCARLLVQHGANLMVANEQDCTPYRLAVKKKKEAVFFFLKPSAAVVDAANSKSVSLPVPLMRLCFNVYRFALILVVVKSTFACRTSPEVHIFFHAFLRVFLRTRCPEKRSNDNLSHLWFVRH